MLAGLLVLKLSLAFLICCVSIIQFGFSRLTKGARGKAIACLFLFEVLGRITSIPTNAMRKFMGNSLFERVIVENVSTPPSKCSAVPLAVPPPRPSLMFSCWFWSENAEIHLCPMSCWEIVKYEVMGIMCFWFSTFLPTEDEERCRLFAATCVLHHCTKMFLHVILFLGWKGIISGNINFLTMPGLIPFQFWNHIKIRSGTTKGMWSTGALAVQWLWFFWVGSSACGFSQWLSALRIFASIASSFFNVKT